MRNMPDNSVDAIVTDPPYGLSNTTPDQVAETIVKWVSGDREYLPTGKGFMGKAWDAFVPPVAVWDEAMRVLKPGGHILAFAGTRTMDLMTLGLRLAGFDIRDSVAWLYGSGFPKSHDVGEAIDKRAGAEREVVGYSQGRSSAIHGGGQSVGRPGPITTPATDAAKQWDGWGTALKPAVEPIVAARNPFKGTVAANVLEHGTGALNIDASRVGMSDADREAAKVPMGDWSRSGTTGSTDSRNGATFEPSPAGRWPANVILDEHMAGALDEQSGVSKSPAPYVQQSKSVGIYGAEKHHDRPSTHHGDSGGASRFFYIARKDNECPSGQSSSTVSTAEMSSSGEGQPPASAPNGAATSERHDTGKQTDSPSTSETQNGSKPNETTDTPTTPTIESVSSPERQHASTTLTRNPANSAEPNPQTDTMTTTTSHLKSAGSAESGTSSTTEKAEERGHLDLGD